MEVGEKEEIYHSKSGSESGPLSQNNSILLNKRINEAAENVSKRQITEKRLEQKLDNTIKAINLFTADNQDFPLDINFSRGLMKDFIVRNRLVRETVLQQCVLYLSLFLELLKKESEINNTKCCPFEDGLLRVGIIGGGIMGKLLFELLHGKTLCETKIEAEISTRVPEKLNVDMLSDLKVYCDNKQCVENCPVVFLCVPKHKLKYAVNSIRDEFKACRTKGRPTLLVSIVGNLPQKKLPHLMNDDLGAFVQTTVDYAQLEEMLREAKERKGIKEGTDIREYAQELAVKSLANKERVLEIIEAYCNLCGRPIEQEEKAEVDGKKASIKPKSLVDAYKNSEMLFTEHFFMKAAGTVGNNISQKEKARRQKDEKLVEDPLAKLWKIDNLGELEQSFEMISRNNLSRASQSLFKQWNSQEQKLETLEKNT